MDDDLKKVELETAIVKLERHKLLLQKEMASSRPQRSMWRRYLLVTSLVILCIAGYGIYRVDLNNQCDSWRHWRWFDLLSEELKKDPLKYERYMETVGQIKSNEAPETWAGARSLFPYMVEKTRLSRLVDPGFIEKTVNQVRLESIANLGCKG